MGVTGNCVALGANTVVNEDYEFVLKPEGVPEMRTVCTPEEMSVLQKIISRMIIERRFGPIITGETNAPKP